MGKCVACGKHGLFLFVDANGLCKSCAEKERIRAQAEAEAALVKQKKASVMPPYIDFGIERLYKTRVYNCDIRDYTGKNIKEYDEVTFVRNMTAYNNDEYGYSAKVMHNGKMIGYVDRQGINDMIHDVVVRAYIVNPEFSTPSFDIAAYSKITSLPAISVMRLQALPEDIAAYNQLKGDIKKFTPVNIDDGRVYYSGRKIGSISEKDIAKLNDIPEDRELYPVFFSERTDKNGNFILSIKVYYSVGEDDLFRDTRPS